MRCLLLFKWFYRLTLFLAAFILMTGQSFAVVQVNLVAKEFTKTMPDSKEVTMWGFARAADGVLDCHNPTPPNIIEGPSVPGPKITVPVGDSLSITLCNELSQPVSLVIPGQIATETGAMTPVWTDNETGDRMSLSQRVRSFTHETPGVIPGMPPTYSSVTYTWNNFKPGTYAYQSGTHPQVQIQMGLYGAAVKDHVLNRAYSNPSTSYDSEILIFISEIDPELHAEVDFYGTSITSTLDYNPIYFLINGAPYSASSRPVYVGAPGENILLRLINMGLKTHVPVLKKDHLKLIAEDGNEYPYPKEQYSAILTAGKTMDAIWNPSGNGNVTAYDRRLNLTNAAAAGPGGLYFDMDVCSDRPAVINTIPTATGYRTLQNAFDAVADLEIIDNRFDIYNEDAVYNRAAVTAYLRAVYACLETPSDNVILSSGSITISDGTIIIGSP